MIDKEEELEGKREKINWWQLAMNSIAGMGTVAGEKGVLRLSPEGEEEKNYNRDTLVNPTSEGW